MGNPVIAGLLGVCFVAGCTLILDFDDPPTPPDAVPVDAIPVDACSFGEANDSREAAFALSAPVSGQLAGICTEGDRDFYVITVGASQTLTFGITFAQEGSRGDLDMHLRNELGTVIARSVSTDADEQIICPGASPSCPQLAEGVYYIEVFGFADATLNGYTIDFSLTGGAAPVDAAP